MYIMYLFEDSGRLLCCSNLELSGNYHISSIPRPREAELTSELKIMKTKSEIRKLSFYLIFKFMAL